MVQAILKEIELPSDFISEKNIETVYFGGGTPSLLSHDELQSIMHTIRSNFSLSPDAEISFEANPDDIRVEALTGWKSAGINRLSLGIQTFDDAELSWMNRAHTSSEAIKSLDLIQAAGFTNFSADLIYGSPILSNEQLNLNFSNLASRRVPHISCYALTVEPNTALGKMTAIKKTKAPLPEKQAEQFDLLVSLMNAAGYEQYEVSNFCLPGFRSRHNSNYWKGISYFGFGPSAHSFNGFDKRRWNVSNNALYLSALERNTIPFEEEILTAENRMNEFIMTALRRSEGIDLNLFTKHFGADNAGFLISGFQKFVNTGSGEIIKSSLVLSEKGKFLADGIAADLFF